MAALGNDATVRTYPLPSATLIHAWTYPAPGPTPVDVSLSASGTALGQVIQVTAGQIYNREVSGINGGAPSWSDTQTSGSPDVGEPFSVWNAGAVAGPRVVFQCGSQLTAQPY